LSLRVIAREVAEQVEVRSDPDVRCKDIYSLGKISSFGGIIFRGFGIFSTFA
jgi:hypothetical protein